MLFIFDMGGVVTTTAGNKLIEDVCKKLAISQDEFYKLCSKPTDLLKMHETGQITCKEFWAEFGKRSSLNIKTDWFRVLYHPELNCETVELIKKLKAEGHRVVCGTNTIDSHYDNHLSRADYTYFDMTYTSIHLGVAKPDPDFWKMIMEIEGYSCDETFFTDDKIENCKASKALGINTYLFESAAGYKKFIDETINKKQLK